MEKASFRCAFSFTFGGCNFYFRSMISMSTVNETELLYVQAISPDPYVSYEVVSAVLKFAPDTLVYVFDSGRAKIIDTP